MAFIELFGAIFLMGLFIFEVLWNVAKGMAFKIRMQKGQYYPLFKSIDGYDPKYRDEMNKQISFKFVPNPYLKDLNSIEKEKSISDELKTEAYKIKLEKERENIREVLKDITEGTV